MRSPLSQETDRHVHCRSFRGLLDHRATGHVDGKGGRDDAKIDKAREDRTSAALYSKICAKFTNGARAGWGFFLERTCTDGDCKEDCSGSNRDRQCRIFDFAPHWKVVLRTPEALEEHQIDQKARLPSQSSSQWLLTSLSLAPLSTEERLVPRLPLRLHPLLDVDHFADKPALSDRGRRSARLQLVPLLAERLHALFRVVAVRVGTRFGCRVLLCRG